MDERSRVVGQMLLNESVHWIGLVATVFALLHSAYKVVKVINEIVFSFCQGPFFYHPILYMAMIAPGWPGKCLHITIFFVKII